LLHALEIGWFDFLDLFFGFLDELMIFRQRHYSTSEETQNSKRVTDSWLGSQDCGFHRWRDDVCLRPAIRL
jgi:hypothetical protein